MSKNVLVVGGGGREHAITWKIAQSEHVKNIYALPGSVAISKIPKTKIVQGDVKNFKEIAYLCKDNEIDIVVVGPEDPLANGIGDYLTQFNIKVFGPCILGAQIESNKQWAKSFFNRHDIPTARWKAFYDAEEAKTFIQEADFNALVVKASGLAAGKGVVVAKNKDEACKAVDDILGEKKFGTAGETVVIEELLIGDEVSVLAFTDGTTVKPMLPAQDHKRIFDNDEGPNTGGMGAYCPCPLITQQDLEYVTTNILQKTVDGLKKEKIPYVGVLYAGLMLTPNGIKILEYNCRFGDPETEVILPLLETDLYEIMENCCNGTLHQCQIRWKENLTAVGVVMASRGYPETSSKGQVITGLENVDSKSDHIIFHCGTQFQNGNYVTNGGRVLIVVALASQLSAASFNATKSCDAINFDGRQFRKDIAHKGIVRSILTTGKLTYKDSGVDISAGNDLVEHIKPVAKSTDRSGVMGSLGGFGGLFDLKNAGFHDPLLVSGTDGVGTKLKIAQEVGIHNTIGIDLVAMCVNDVLAHGAEPLFFLDYFACGQLDVDTAKNVVSGVGEGCRRAGCSLIGGETAEMPDMYKPGEYDVAGFAVGAVERNSLIPKIAEISPNDIVIGLSSSGVHSNGLSLVRKVVELSGVPYSNLAPFSKHGKTLGEEILTPTHIYVKPVLQAVKTGKVKAFAHITGGGLLENVPRVLPKHLGVELDAFKWNIPEIFAWLAVQGQINVTEMLRTFNCGIGGILIVNPQFADEIMKLLPQDIAQVIGKVNVITSSGAQVIVQNFCEAIELKMRPYLKKTVSRQKKRVGVLISGSGTNLQALIDAKGPDSEIVLIISNKDDVEGLRRAQRAGIKTKVIKHKDFPTREAYDAVLDATLIAEGVEIVCLAGFMRILSSFFTNKWRGRLLNVHPALLPAFKGVRAQKQALDAGVRVAGCTVHFVEADVDAGAIIAQEAVPVEINETEESLIEKIKLCEHKIFPHALQLVASGKVRLESDGTLAWSI